MTKLNKVPKLQNPTYEDIHQACLYLAHQIQICEFDLDVIVGVSRGGLIPATILSQLLDVKLVPVCYSSKNGHGDDLNHDNQLPDLSDRNILIVDDICDSGHTLKEMFDHYTNAGGATVMTACVYYKHHENPIFVPNMKWITITADSGWIVFPWEQNVLVSKQLS